VLTTTAGSLLDAFTELLKGAIDSGDAEFFTEAAGDYWQALPLRLFGNDRVDTSLDSEDTAGAALPRAMGTFRAEVESRRSALWTALGAWCVEWISSETTASVTNRRIFATIADRLPDFRTLWQAFLRSLDEESRGRFPLTWWERGKSRAEGMITWQKPGRLQARFFALLALARVPPDVDESITGLAVPEQASWVRGLVNGALDDLGPRSAFWRELLGQADWQAADDAIRRLITALEEDDERRERARLVDTPLSCEKRSTFRADIFNAWYSTAFIRRMFQEAGAYAEVTVASRDLVFSAGPTLLSRGFFVQDAGTIHYMAPGRDLGLALAKGENAKLHETIRAQARQVSTQDRRP
jgi:hypothetical protein